MPFDEAAARRFDDLRRMKLRIGSRDLKIAATAADQPRTSRIRQPNRFRKSVRLASRDLARLTERRRGKASRDARDCSILD